MEREYGASAGRPACALEVCTLVWLGWRLEDVATAEEALRAVADHALAEGLRPRWGRRVLEIRPPIKADKGTAVSRLLGESSLRRALYAGDDTTDLDAFRGLDGLEVAVRIAVVSDEAPDQLAHAADVIVGGPEALAELLAQL